MWVLEVVCALLALSVGTHAFRAAIPPRPARFSSRRPRQLPQNRDAFHSGRSRGIALSAMEAPQEAVRFLQCATPLASQVLFLSPLTAMGSFRAEGTGDASSMPYAAMVTNGAAWCCYALTASPSPDMTILLANLGGIVFGLAYCWTYRANMSPGSDAPVLFPAALAVVCGLLAAAATLPAEVAHEVAGYAGVSASVLMFSGPLASVQAILRDCSAKSLPIGFTACAAANCALWTAYGVFAIDDPLVWVRTLRCNCSLYDTAVYTTPQSTNVGTRHDTTPRCLTAFLISITCALGAKRRRPRGLSDAARTVREVRRERGRLRTVRLIQRAATALYTHLKVKYGR